MGNYAIQVRGLGKSYTIGAYQGRYKSLRDSLTSAFLAPLRRLGQGGAAEKAERTIWALKDVSFDIQHGEVVGIIGRNGAGKSTLLKLLARITEPSAGEIRMRGRVGSLLEVGTGFHPELTGRENIFLNGAILGMSRAEIQRKFDEIVDFAEIEKFIDTPAKHYSSGMYMRLAFAVAAHLEPEILLVDEVLAVGDAQFQKKCLGKMDEVARQGRTVLFVSHNMGAIAQLCRRVVFIQNGKVYLDGDTEEVLSVYFKNGQSDQRGAAFSEDPSKSVQILEMALVDIDGSPMNACPHTDPFQLIIKYRVSKWNVGSYLCIDIFNELEMRIMWSSDAKTVEEMMEDRKPGIYTARVTIPGGVLAPGRYYFTAAFFAPGRQWPFDVRDKTISLEVVDGGSLLSNFGIKPHAATMIPMDWQTDFLE